MKFFIDTAELNEIIKANNLGLCDGVTTNPSLIMKSGRDHKEVIKEISKIVKGPISVEGVGETSDQMVKDALEFVKWGPNIVAKIPMTDEGIKAVRELSSKGIKTNVTLIFSSTQALIAAKAGATYVSPFVGRFDDISQDGMQLIKDIMMIFNAYNIKTEIIVASIRDPIHVVEAAKIGAHISTFPYSILDKMLRHPLTDIGIRKFLDDFHKSKR